jgi:hypothetical protein
VALNDDELTDAVVALECWAAQTCSRFRLLRRAQYAVVEITKSRQSSFAVSDYNPGELLLVCESIIEDGELTYDELYRLADWLNNHHEACHHWPGNKLVEPLQNAWADGKVTKTEARQIARIILQIRKEAAKREAAEAFAQAVEVASQTVCSFDLTAPNCQQSRSLPALSRTQVGAFFTRLILVVPPAPILTSSHIVTDCPRDI